jgi:hypothetical protein
LRASVEVNGADDARAEAIGPWLGGAGSLIARPAWLAVIDGSGGPNARADGHRWLWSTHNDRRIGKMGLERTGGRAVTGELNGRGLMDGSDQADDR